MLSRVNSEVWSSPGNMLLHCTPQLMSLVLGTTSTLLKVREATWVQLNIDCLIDFLKCLTCCGAAETFPLHCAGFARSHNLVNPSCQTPSYMLEPASYEDLYLHPHVKCGDRGRKHLWLRTDDVLFPERRAESFTEGCFWWKRCFHSKLFPSGSVGSALQLHHMVCWHN